MSKALIIGFGSIGKLHAEILQGLNFQVYLVTKQSISSFQTFENIKDALEQHDIEYIIVSNITSKHYETLQELVNLGYKGKLLIEKPLYNNIPKKHDTFPFEIGVGYNLRFNPVIIEISKLLVNQKITSSHHYVGQHLSTWRNLEDYKTNYSANKKMGGGVLRDLSHEIDLMLFLYGDIKKYFFLGGKFSDVTVDSDEVATFVMQNDNCPAISLQMNYYDHVKRREGIINTEEFSLKYDLVNSKYYINEKEISVVNSKETSYLNMHKSFLYDKKTSICSLSNGLEIVKIINNIENE